MISAKRRTKKINDRAKNENEKKVEMTNATNENFDMHRRFVLTIALKIVDRKESEIFTADDTTDEEKINEITVIDEAIKKVNVVIVFDAVNEEKEKEEQISLTNLL